MEIAVGSAFETDSQRLMAEKLGFVTSLQTTELFALLNEEQRTLSVFIKKLTANT